MGRGKTALRCRFYKALTNIAGSREQVQTVREARPYTPPSFRDGMQAAPAIAWPQAMWLFTDEVIPKLADYTPYSCSKSFLEGGPRQCISMSIIQHYSNEHHGSRWVNR